MASRIKGITIELNGDTTGLDKALKGVNGELSSTQKQLKDVDRLLKLDPTNTTLLAQKQRLLGEAVQQSATKLDTLREAQRQLDAQIAAGGEKNVAQYEALQREIAATELQMRNFQEQSENLNKSAESAGKLEGGLKKAAAASGSLKVALAAAAAAAVTGLGRGAAELIAYSDDLNTLAKQSGFTPAELQKMAYAANLVDVSQETIVSSARKLKTNMKSTSAEVTAAWDRIGVSVKNVDGSFRNSNDVFFDTIKALSRVSNETERDTLAMTLFGRSADDLAGIIDDGGEALQRLGNEAEAAGLILDESQLQSLNEINDELDELKAKAKGTFGEVMATFLVENREEIDKIVEGLSNLLDWITVVSDKIEAFGRTEYGQALKNEIADGGITAPGRKAAEWVQSLFVKENWEDPIGNFIGYEYQQGVGFVPRGSGGGTFAAGTAATSEGTAVNVSINFEGDLAQVGAVLAPSVTAEQRRVGDDLSR